ncbi:MAG: sugar ABC transporter permease [Opitutae bacterium]|nr:sugar ABC transporter permease [Opitutae bacterium]
MSGARSGTGFSSFIPLFGPFILLWALFWLVPLFYGVELSLSGSVGANLPKTQFNESDSIYLGNYQTAFNDVKFLKSIENTTLFVLGSISLSLILGFCLAVVIFKLHRILQALCLFVLLIPSLALPGTLAKLFYLFFHGKSGALNQFIVLPLGFDPINWMMNPDWILPCLIFQSVWRWVGLVTLLLYCGMRAIPRWQFETARLEGATEGQIIRSILLPGVRHLLWFAAVFLLVDGVAAFSGAYNLLGGSGGVLDAGLLFVTYAYQVAFPGGSGRFDLPLASAMSVMVAVGAACIAFLMIRVNAKKRVVE